MVYAKPKREIGKRIQPGPVNTLTSAYGEDAWKNPPRYQARTNQLVQSPITTEDLATLAVMYGLPQTKFTEFVRARHGAISYQDAVIVAQAVRHARYEGDLSYLDDDSIMLLREMGIIG